MTFVLSSYKPQVPYALHHSHPRRVARALNFYLARLIELLDGRKGKSKAHGAAIFSPAFQVYEKRVAGVLFLLFPTPTLADFVANLILTRATRAPVVRWRP